MDETDWRTGHSRDELLVMLEWVRGQWNERGGWLFGAACLRRIWDLLSDPRFRDLVEAAEGRASCTLSEVDFDAVRGRLPLIANWRPPVPSPLLWEAPQHRPMHFGGPEPHVPPPGVLNFRELPAWVQETHHATTNLGVCHLRGVVVYAAAARGHHTGEQSREHMPIDGQIDAINRETDRLQREYDDAVWRGMSSAERKGDALRQRREQAEFKVSQLRGEQQAVWDRVVEAARAAEHAAQADLLRCVAGNPFRPIPFDPRWRTETAVALARGIEADRAFDRMPILADALEETGCDDLDVLAHCRSPGPHALGCWVIHGLR